MREELIKIIEQGLEVAYINGTFHLSMDCLWSEIISGKLVLKEHEDARWLTREKLDDVQWLPADITLIEKLKSIIRLSKEKKYGQVFN